MAPITKKLAKKAKKVFPKLALKGLREHNQFKEHNQKKKGIIISQMDTTQNT